MRSYIQYIQYIQYDFSSTTVKLSIEYNSLLEPQS